MTPPVEYSVTAYEQNDYTWLGLQGSDGSLVVPTFEASLIPYDVEYNILEFELIGSIPDSCEELTNDIVNDVITPLHYQTPNSGLTLVPSSFVIISCGRSGAGLSLFIPGFLSLDAQSPNLDLGLEEGASYNFQLP